HPRMVSHKSSPNSDVRSVKAEHPRMAWRKSSPTSPAQGANTSNQGYYWGGNQGYGGLYLNWGGWGGASWRRSSARARGPVWDLQVYAQLRGRAFRRGPKRRGWNDPARLCMCARKGR